MGVLTLSACSLSEPPVPTAREQACESIKGLTPGYLEAHWAIETLSDKGATPSERLDALKQQTAPAPTTPYTCEGAVFERYASEQG